MRASLKIAASLWLFAGSAEAWNSLGHRLVAQIAYDHLTPRAKRLANHYLHALDERYGSCSFVNAAAWLDYVPGPQNRWYKPMHYIDLPYSPDGSSVRLPSRVNAVRAILYANQVLNSDNATLLTKGFHFRVLMHVIGDIHQPLHAMSLYSRQFPEGDKGGNLYRLKSSPVGPNLHTYWDRGGGFLQPSSPQTGYDFYQQVHLIESDWPCKFESKVLSPATWAKTSHNLAVKYAYRVSPYQTPTKVYEKMAKRISEKRIALAGCRLANVLNHLS